MSWRIEERFARLERDQEALRAHYDRLYGLNVEAIEQMRAEVRSLADLVQAQRLPLPAEVPTVPDVPRTWHQNLRAKRVALPTAGLGAAALWTLLELVRYWLSRQP